MQVKIQPTYLTLGVDFCVHGPFYPTIKVAILQLRGAVEKIWKQRQIEDHRRQKQEKNFGGKREYHRKEESLTT